MRTLRMLVAAIAVVAALAGYRQLPDFPGLELPAGAGPAPESIDNWHGPEPIRSEVLAALGQARVVPSRPAVPGYDRDCGPAEGCVFGPAWSDDTSAALGHDGCDTRNGVLAQQLTDVGFREGTRNCVVISGLLEDPYTGQTLTFAKEDASAVQIDHIFPLARAWDMGASSWSLEQRKTFANDPVHNLLAVDGRANASKGDQGPGEWMPINRGYACTYAARYLDAANTYDLAITAADADALEEAAQTCATARGPEPTASH